MLAFVTLFSVSYLIFAALLHALGALLYAVD
jgi:hypothetical protein